MLERDVARGELYLADEVFITGTAAEICPVNEVDDHPLGPPARSRGPSRSASSPPPRAATRARPSGSTTSRRPRPRRPRARPHMSERVRIYDTTLRDGMQREGMSLSVGEQLAVALRLAEFGVDYIEAGFPAATPRTASSSALLEREDLGAARVAAFGMTRRRGVAAERRPRPCAAWPRASRPWPPSSARPGTCTCRRSPGSRREENLRHDRGVGGLPGPPGQGGDLRRRALLRRLRRPPRVRARLCLRAAEAGGAAWITPCDTNGATLPDARRRGHARPCARRCPACAWASTPTTTPSAGWPTPWPRSRRARAWSRARSTATASAAATPT